MRQIRTLLVLACIALTACGGGSSSESSNSGGSSGRPKATRTPRPATPVPEPQTLFVRPDGNDTNPGTDPTMALKTITAAVKVLRAGTTVYIGPGSYTGRVEITGKEGTAALPIRLVADPTGTNTHQRAGEVEINAAGDTVAVVITKSPYVSIEGFLITGAEPQESVAATAVQIRSNSQNVTIRDCLIGNGSEADGIRVAASADVLIFNNLIFRNDRGIVVSGAAPRTRIINNTIVDHLRAGISISESGTNAPEHTMVLNNIIQGNDSNVAVSVDDAVNYEGDYNLVFEYDVEDQGGNYAPRAIRGAHDINEDALFENVPQQDVRLTADSPAIDAGTPMIGQALTADLFNRYATVDLKKDRTPPDLGFHYRQ
jgi:parallel beta-helix repeat protein